MTIEEAIAELKEDIALYIPTNGTIEEVDRELPDGRLITALEMGIKALERQKTGRWILNGTTDCDGNNNYICSNCSHGDTHAKGQKVPFCWWCGARMEAENADSD